MILVRYHVGASTIAPAGQGIFVDEAVARGRVLVAPDAIPRTWKREEIEAHPNRANLLPSVIRWFEDHYTVTPDWPDECYLNHSFEPTGIWHLGFVFAARDLAAGDEVTVDYRHLLAEGESEVFTDATTGRPIVGIGWRDSLRESAEQLARAGMKLTPLPRAAYRRMRWKNDRGWTTEIARAPIDGEAFDWRVSLAEIDQDCEFSRFDGCDRSLIVLDGTGIELRFGAGREPLLLRDRGRVAIFSGDEPATCRLLDGPTRDFNVMTRREVWTHKAMFRPLLGPMVVFPEPNVHWLVHVVSGSARRQHVDGAPVLNTGDSALIEPDDGAERQFVLSGGGELILVRFEAGAAA